MRLKVFGFFLTIQLLIGLSYMSLHQVDGQLLQAAAAEPETQVSANFIEPKIDLPKAATEPILNHSKPTPKNYQVSVRNWNNSYQALYEEQIKAIDQLMAILPAEHTQDLSMILDYGDAYRALGGENFVIIGVNEVETMDEFIALLVHEIGHCLHDKLNPNEQKLPSQYKGVDNTSQAVAFYNISWYNDSDQREVNNDLGFVSDYSKTNPYEDFAEAYGAYVVLGPEMRFMAESNTVVMQKYTFMKNIFEGKEFEGVLGEVDLEDREWDMTKIPNDSEALLAMNR